jgi:hypothetical protein
VGKKEFISGDYDINFIDKLNDIGSESRNIYLSELDKEVAARDVKALLSDEQIAAMDVAWTEQQALRKVKRARTKEEERELGWKTKREIYIEAYEKALNEANDEQVDAWTKKLRDAEIRQARIYFETYGKARDERKDIQTAKNIANNALTAAGLSRLDGNVVGHLSKRDKEVWAMEDAIRAQIRKNMTPEELEQLEMLEEHERELAKGRGKAGGRAGKP